MRLCKFDPRLRHVDEAGCITHFAGVKIDSAKGIEWISVDDLPGDPPYVELLKATDREYMEHFRNDWANTWRIANIPPPPTTASNCPQTKASSIILNPDADSTPAC